MTRDLNIPIDLCEALKAPADLMFIHRQSEHAYNSALEGKTESSGSIYFHSTGNLFDWTGCATLCYMQFIKAWVGVKKNSTIFMNLLEVINQFQIMLHLPEWIATPLLYVIQTCFDSL